MLTQRWNVSSLSFDVICQYVEKTLICRKVTEEYEPLFSEGKLISDSQILFSRITATEKSRPDIIALITRLLEMSSWVTVHLYSEPDERILTAWRGFEFADTSPLSEDTSLSEMI